MDDFIIMWEWFAFAVRWLHVITAIAWIGSSFYFIALDLGLKKSPNLPAGAYGEEWQVHGGGFYHIQKYSVAPENMPNHLTWFKWESYATWLSGAAMLMIVYWLGAELYLIDPAKADLSVFQAIIISAGSLLVGWVVYDFLCKSALGNNPTGLMLLLFVVLVVMSWGYNQIFTGRISGIAKFGLFVKLDTSGADGIIPLSKLGREYWRYDDRERTLRGEDSGRIISIGMACKVSLVEATAITGGISLEMLELEGKAMPKSSSRQISHKGRRIARSNDKKRKSKRK
ncbi:urate hydroxylase PuuD [Amylibacter sp.]|nr:urate hydroxylase PuuD [Amylibacter sp.]